MSENALSAKRVFMFPAIFTAVLILHVLFISIKSFPDFGILNLSPLAAQNNPLPIKLDSIDLQKIRKVKTQGVSHPNLVTDQAVMDAGSGAKHTVRAPSRPKAPVSLADLGSGLQSSGAPKEQVRAAPKNQRPGSRPEAFPDRPKAMNAMSLKSKEFKNISKSFPSGGLSISDMMTGTQKISDAVVSIEVPDGVNPDELNEYELMFYGFQKRTAINYVNSILKNIDKFQKSHPNYKVQTTGRITMTARISYDKEGNVKQIKMIRWTHEQPMQDLFEDIVKNIDQLHNPPKTLWEKNDEFAMFYTLEIING
jgi:hypothetical protein